jgi:outer membrane protein assembly factor BamD
MRICKYSGSIPAFNRYILVYILSGLALANLVVGCSSSEEKADSTSDWSAEKFFDEAKRESRLGDYTLAIEYFETLEARFPFSKYTPQAQLESAYAYYKNLEYDLAISSAERFIKLHPTHPNVDYAYYLRGLASFHKKDTTLDFLSVSDPSKKDPASTRESFNYFSELVKKFPKSKYSPDAIKRMTFQRNTLAKHELNVANYYMKRGAFVAALNRAKYVVENYQRTPSVPDALVLLAQAYKNLNMDSLAKDANRVLQLNFPNHKVESAQTDTN